jgi:hypothetical protein
MSPNLSDFSNEALQTLLNVVVAKIVDEDNHRKEWLKYFSPWMGGYYDNQKDRAKTYEYLCLWRVQILNAIGKVGIQEVIKSN